MATAAVPRVFKNFINGEWVESRAATRMRTAILRIPTNWSGCLCLRAAEDVDAAVDAAKRRTNVAAGAGAQARRDSVSRRRDCWCNAKKSFRKT